MTIKHYYKVYKKNHPKLPTDVVGMYDLGFLGVENDFPEQKSSLPFKKEKDCELTVQQKRVQQKSFCKEDSDRTCYCQIKKYRIVNDGFRNRLRKYDRISDIVSGLINCRIVNIC